MVGELCSVGDSECIGRVNRCAITSCLDLEDGGVPKCDATVLMQCHVQHILVKLPFSWLIRSQEPAILLNQDLSAGWASMVSRRCVTTVKRKNCSRLAKPRLLGQPTDN